MTFINAFPKVLVSVNSVQTEAFHVSLRVKSGFVNLDPWLAKGKRLFGAEQKRETAVAENKFTL